MTRSHFTFLLAALLAYTWLGSTEGERGLHGSWRVLLYALQIGPPRTGHSTLCSGHTAVETLDVVKHHVAERLTYHPVVCGAELKREHPLDIARRDYGKREPHGADTRWTGVAGAGPSLLRTVPPTTRAALRDGMSREPARAEGGRELRTGLRCPDENMCVGGASASGSDSGNVCYSLMSPPARVSAAWSSRGSGSRLLGRVRTSVSRTCTSARQRPRRGCTWRGRSHLRQEDCPPRAQAQLALCEDEEVEEVGVVDGVTAMEPQRAGGRRL